MGGETRRRERTIHVGVWKRGKIFWLLGIRGTRFGRVELKRMLRLPLRLHVRLDFHETIAAHKGLGLLSIGGAQLEMSKRPTNS